MRKVYVVIGTHTDKQGYYNWVSGVYSSYKRATKSCYLLKISKPENEYNIQTEVLI